MNFSIINSTHMGSRDMGLMMEDLKFVLHEVHWVRGQPLSVTLEAKKPITDFTSMEQFASNVNMATKYTVVHPYGKVEGTNLVCCYISAKTVEQKPAEKAETAEKPKEEKKEEPIDKTIPLNTNVKSAAKKVVKKTAKKKTRKRRN